MFNACKLLGRDFHASPYRFAYLACKLVPTRLKAENVRLHHEQTYDAHLLVDSNQPSPAGQSDNSSNRPWPTTTPKSPSSNGSGDANIPGN